VLTTLVPKGESASTAPFPAEFVTFGYADGVANSVWDSNRPTYANSNETGTLAGGPAQRSEAFGVVAEDQNRETLAKPGRFAGLKELAEAPSANDIC